MEKIFQVYVPQYHRTYKRETLSAIHSQLWTMKDKGARGIWLIGLWDSDWSDIGFSIKEYSVNPNFGTIIDLTSLIKSAHAIGLEVGCDIVPNHVSCEHDLVKNTKGNGIYIVDAEDAEQFTANGVQSFFGEKPYSYVNTNKFGRVLVRTKFSDSRQVDVNWENPTVRDHFRQNFGYIKKLGFDFVRVDCAEILLEDVSKANKQDRFACFNARASIESIVDVSEGMKLFLECFNPEIIQYDFGDNVYICDCSFVMDGGTDDYDEFKRKTFKYASFANYVPIIGGHDQMPFKNRFGFKFDDSKFQKTKNKYLFTDYATEIGFKNEAENYSDEDAKYDVDLDNPNKRWMARCPISQIL